jgi:hypothetical protein
VSVPSPRPLSLSDAQLETVMAYAAPLQAADRGEFLNNVVAALAAAPEIGEGLLMRVCRAEQSRFGKACDTVTGALPRPSRWSGHDIGVRRTRRARATG